MEMIIPLLCILGAIAIAWWVFTKMSLPEPIRMIVYIVVAIVAIAFLLSIASGGLGSFHLGHFSRN